MIDIVVPKNNEEELLAMAKKLGFKELCFFYEKIPPLFYELQKKSSVKLCAAQAKQGGQVDMRILFGRDGLRPAIERKAIDTCVDVELGRDADFMHARNSSINQVIAQLMRAKGVTLCWSVATLLSLDEKERPIVFGRMFQNVEICRKYNVRMACASFAQTPLQMRKPSEIIAFLRVLGLEGNEPKLALSALWEQIKHNRERKSPDYMGEGISLVK